MARDQEKIGERSAEHWLNILNRNAEWTIAITYTMFLRYEGHDYFFVSGQFNQVIYSHSGLPETRNAFFLVAIGKPAVQILSDQDHLFRKISGSEELAAFSIYRWSEFTDALIRKGPPSNHFSP